jgi:hypothetical protein
MAPEQASKTVTRALSPTLSNEDQPCRNCADRQQFRNARFRYSLKIARDCGA